MPPEQPQAGTAATPRCSREMPGAVSFMSYCTMARANQNTITMLDFGTLEDARRAAVSDHLKTILQEIWATGVDHPRVLVVERPPFTPEPLRP
jgi:hypothetical protein